MNIIHDFDRKTNEIFKTEKLTERKLKTKNVVDIYERFDKISDSKIERIKHCGDYLLFMVDATKTKRRLASANFCRDKFCPICSKNLAMKNFIALRAVSQWIQNEHNKAFIFVTLTAPNVYNYALKDEISRFNKSFNNLLKYNEIKTINKGFVRKLEVTYNKKDKSYHTHFHVLMAVNPSYFINRSYINHDKWLSMWQQAMRDDSITQVDVRRVKNGVEKATLEITKYIAKDNDYLINDEVFRTFYDALHYKKMITYGGLFKDGIKKFKNNELDDYLEIDEVEWKYLLYFIWNKSKYKFKSLNEMSDADKISFIKKIDNEIKADI